MEKKRIKILYLIPELPNAGQERQLYYLLQSIDQQKYPTAVAVWNYLESDHYVRPIQDLGITIFPLSPEVSIASKILGLKRIVNEVKPEIIHVFAFHLNFIAWIVSLFQRSIPVGGLRNTHQFYLERVNRIIGIVSSLFPGNKIANNYKGAKELDNYSKFIKLKTYVVTNKLKLSDFESVENKVGESFKIACIGRLDKEKRWDVALKVFKKLKDSGFGISVEIAGNGLLKDELENAIGEQNLQNEIKLIGNVNDVSSFFSRNNIQVHTADFEGMPNVIMEAMACGRAVVATNAGDTSQLIENGINGYVVNCGDVEGLYRRIVSLIEDPSMCIAMGLKGREIAENRFKVELLRKETFDIYKKIGWKENL